MTEQPTTPETPQTPATPPANQGEQRFSQDDVNRIVGERAKDAAKAAVSKLLTDLGYDNLDTLKTKLTAAKQREDAEMSEVERVQKDAEAARKERDELKRQYEQEKAQRIVDRRDSAIVTAAQSARAEAPGDVVFWAEKHAAAELAKTVKEDGTVDDAAVKALIEKCRQERKGWFTGSAPGSPSNSGGQLPQPDLNKAHEGMKIPRL